MDSTIAIKLKEYRKSERAGGYHFLVIYSDYKVIFGKMTMSGTPFQQAFTYQEFLDNAYDPLVKKKFGIMRIRHTQEVLRILLEHEGAPYIKKWENEGNELLLMRNERALTLKYGDIIKKASWSDFIFDPFQVEVKEIMGKAITREARKTIELIQRHSQ